jgi:hypothetical protein
LRSMQFISFSPQISQNEAVNIMQKNDIDGEKEHTELVNTQ